MLFPAGCSTTTQPARTAYNTADTIVISVDTAMKGWADYVVQTRAHLAGTRDQAGLAVLASKEARVSQGYADYQKAALVAISGSMGASTSGTNVTIQVASGIASASAPLIALIAELTK